LELETRSQLPLGHSDTWQARWEGIRPVTLRADIHAAKSRPEVFLVRHFLFLIVAVVGWSTSVFAQWPPAPGHTALEVWPHGAPGAAANPAPEGDTTTAKDHLVAGKAVIRIGNVSLPTLTLYTPTGKSTGAAAVVFPGGGYRILAIDLEGTEVCDWLNSARITCVLLKYRVPDTGPFPKSAAALQDAQRALGIVRSHAAEWHIDPKRIGVLGFSAGRTLPQPSALISINAFTIRSTLLTRSVAGRILR